MDSDFIFPDDLESQEHFEVIERRVFLSKGSKDLIVGLLLVGLVSFLIYVSSSGVGNTKKKSLIPLNMSKTQNNPNNPTNNPINNNNPTKERIFFFQKNTVGTRSILFSADYNGKTWTLSPHHGIQKQDISGLNIIAYPSISGNRVVYRDSGNRLQIFNLDKEDHEPVSFDEPIYNVSMDAEGTKILVATLNDKSAFRSLKLVGYNQVSKKWDRVKEILPEFSKTCSSPLISSDGNWIFYVNHPPDGPFTINKFHLGDNNDYFLRSIVLKSDLGIDPHLIASPNNKMCATLQAPKAFGLKSMITGHCYNLVLVDLDTNLESVIPLKLVGKGESIRLLKWSNDGNSLYLSIGAESKTLYQFILENRNLFMIG